MAIAHAANGSMSSFNGAISKPAGLSATPYRLVVFLTWFATNSPPAISGWTLVDWASDNRSSDRTSTALFFRDVADGSAAASSVTPTGITDWLGQMIAITGTIDASYTSAEQGSQVDAIVEPGPLSAPRDGSFLVMAGGCWNFNAWTASGFGGAQIYPSGFVASLGNTNGSELGGFYSDDIPAGAIDTEFSDSIERFAVVAAVFAPPDETVLVARSIIPFID